MIFREDFWSEKICMIFYSLETSSSRSENPDWPETLATAPLTFDKFPCSENSSWD